MEIGNIVKPTKESKFTLRSGCEYYDDAIVISVEPFILTSRESDMRWETTIIKSDFEIIGNIDNSRLKHCMRRLNKNA